MKRSFVRMLAAATAMVAGIAVTGLPATAEVTSYAGRANGVGVQLSLLDTISLAGGVSDATVTTGPTGAATGVGLDLLDMTVSQVENTTGTGYDPEDPDQRNCLLPDDPSDLGLPIGGLTVGVVCSSAEVVAGGHAAAEAEIAGLDLDGTLVSDLVSFLIEQVGADVAAALDEGLETAESTTGPLLEPVITPLAEGCQAGLEELVLGVGPVFDLVQDLAEQDPSGIIAVLTDPLVQALGALPEACSSLLTLLLDLPSLTVVLETIEDALVAALEGLDLVEISIGGSSGVVDLTDTALVAEAGTLAAGVELPSLGALLDAIEIIVADLIGDLVEQLAGSIGETFEDLIPAVEAVLQPVLDALMLPDLLTATDPLLTIAVLPSEATASLDRATGEVTTEGRAVVVEIALSEAFATLLGEESTEITVPGGQSQTILEDTPLESTITLADVAELSREVAGMQTTGTRAVGAELALLTGVNGGISLTIDAAEASVGGTQAAPPPPPDDEGTLPTTGGGLAMLGLLAVASAGLLRRRVG